MASLAPEQIDAVVATARSWRGTRYAHQGRTPGQRLDCLGLVVCVARAHGLSQYDFTQYGPLPSAAVLLREVRAHMDEIPLADARRGDVLVMAWQTEPQHMALLTEDDYIIHAYLGARQVVEHRLDSVWRGRVRHAFRFRRPA